MKFLIFIALLVVLAVASANPEEEELVRDKRALFYGARTFGIGAYPYAYGAHYGYAGHPYYRGWY